MHCFVIITLANSSNGRASQSGRCVKCSLLQDVSIEPVGSLSARSVLLASTVFFPGAFLATGCQECREQVKQCRARRWHCQVTCHTACQPEAEARNGVHCERVHQNGAPWPVAVHGWLSQKRDQKLLAESRSAHHPKHLTHLSLRRRRTRARNQKERARRKKEKRRPKPANDRMDVRGHQNGEWPSSRSTITPVRQDWKRRKCKWPSIVPAVLFLFVFLSLPSFLTPMCLLLLS